MAGENHSDETVQRIRNEQQIYDAFFSESAPTEIYADGFLGIWGDKSVTKIGLYKTRQPKREGEMLVEQRQLFAQLAMPTRSLVELCVKIISQAAASKEQIGVEDLLQEIEIHAGADAPTGSAKS